MHAPPLAVPPELGRTGQYNLDSTPGGALAYTFTFGAAAFFVLDTRTQRVKNSRQKKMLGDQQWQALQEWLLAVKDSHPVKFLVSSSSVLFDIWVDVQRDRWSGFAGERRRLLSFLADHQVEGVYILAGDLHSAHAVRAELDGLPGKPLALWELCSTPFEQDPNPFSTWAHWPFLGKPVRNLKRFFTVSQPNYGVVRVNFDASGQPRVTFDLYGAQGQRLASVS